MTTRLSLRQLQIFESVARHLSYTRAAEELHLTQPAVFAQVKQIEEVIGQPLLERMGKRLFLTDVGREVLNTSREMMASTERLEMRLADLQGLKTGKLRIGIVSTAEYLIPRLLGAFCHEHPGINASLIVTNREQLLTRLTENLDDLVVLGVPPDHLDVVATPIANNPLVVVARRDHPLIQVQNIPLQRLSEELFIVREQGSGVRLAVEKLFFEAGISPRVRMAFGSNESIKQAIASGLGISILPEHALSLDGGGGPLGILDVAGFPLMRRWYVAYLAGKHLSTVAQAFLAYLSESKGSSA